MTTFLYYIYNRSRGHSVHILDGCNHSILRFTVIFRCSSRDRTAHEKKENTAVWCVKAYIHNYFQERFQFRHLLYFYILYTYFIYVRHFLTFYEFPLHILMTFTAKLSFQLNILVSKTIFFAIKINDLIYSAVAPLHASVHPHLPAAATVSFSSTTSMLNKNNSADIQQNHLHSSISTLLPLLSFTSCPYYTLSPLRDDDLYILSLIYLHAHPLDDIYTLSLLY
jgi:hypothetical protein